jgi:hypothetical protein
MSGGYPSARLGELANWQSLSFANNVDENTGTVLCGGPNAKGSWVQLTSSTAGTSLDATALQFCVYGANAGGAGAVGDPISVDFAIGASGSQSIIIPDVTIIWQNDGCDALVPMSIPKGTQIWARGQGVTAGDNICVGAKVVSSSFLTGEGVAGCDCIGFNSGTTLGTAVTWGQTNKGSYTQLIAATTRDYIGFCLSACIAYGATAGGQFVSDVAIGAGGSEYIIVNDVIYSSAGSYITNPISTFYPVPIPKGSRIALRGLHSNSGTATAYQTLYGFY